MGSRMSQTLNSDQSSNFSQSKLNKIPTNWAFVPYNKKWGVSQILGSVPAMISLEQKCVVKLEETTSYLTRAICECVGKEVTTNKKAKYVTFDVEYSEQYGCYVIDDKSFQLFYDSISLLGQLQPCGAFLKVSTFISPDGQSWIDEKKYEEYIKDMEAIFECSDGSLTTCYADFKAWEKELALRPNNPNYISRSQS